MRMGLQRLSGLLAFTLLLSAGTSGCKTREYDSSNSDIQKVKTDANKKVVYIDTHDGYGHSFPIQVWKGGYPYFRKVNGKKPFLFTQDCAWVDPTNGFDLLDALKRNQVKATFFVSGPFLYKNPKQGARLDNLNKVSFPVIRRMIDEGHEIGNHSQTHPHNAAKPDWKKELIDAKAGWEMIVKELYPNGDAPANAQMKPFWRAPFGEYDDASLTAAADAGFPYHFGWTVDVRDGAGFPSCAKSPTDKNCLSAASMTERILQHGEANKWDVVGLVSLAHLSNVFMWGKDPEGLDRLFREMRAHDYEMATVSEAFAFYNKIEEAPVKIPKPNPVPSTQFEDDLNNNPYEEEIRQALTDGLFTKYADGSFRPTLALSRGQMVQEIVSILQIFPRKQFSTAKPATAPFPDITLDRWDAGLIHFAKQQGLVSALSDGNFQPQTTVTRAQLMTTMEATAKYVKATLNLSPTLTAFDNQFNFSDISSHAAAKSIQTMSAYCHTASPLSEKGEAFAPDAPATRDYAAAVGIRLIKCMRKEKN